MKRIVILIMLALTIGIILIIRIIQIQLLERGKYVEKAREQYILEMKLASNRGYIYDRNFNYLAINKPVFSLGVDVSKVTDPEYAASQFSDVLGGTKSNYIRQLSNGSPFIWVKRGVEENIVNQLENSKISGMRVIREMIRYYPQAKLAAQLVGFTDVDLKGLSGVELAKDASLKGNPGRAFYQKDALGNTFADLTNPIQQPRSGKNVVLTIDNSIQLSVEEELHYTVNRFNAEGGLVIVTNPATGEILAIAIIPTFDPNDAGKYPPTHWRNRVITDSFEPGSTFKPIFMSAILEEEIKKPDDIIFCENGKYKFLDREIEDVSAYGWLTLRKILANSSNIGMSKLAQEIKGDFIYQYIRDFGFGVKTGIGLSGEVAGDLKNTTEWSRATPVALSMGYEISVTALQLAMAYGAIANGGYLLEPQIYINEFYQGDAEDNKLEPKVIRRVISQKTSQTLVSILEEVVQSGTGERANIPGLKIAGKTGTARKYDPVKKTYSTEEFLASFIGFFPANNPDILICVIIDNPKEEYFGGVVAASTFKRILQRILRIMEIDSAKFIKNTRKEYDESDEFIVLPNFVSKKAEVAKKIIEGLALEVEFKNEGELIVNQIPSAGTKVARNSLVILTLNTDKKKIDEYTRIPKVVGLTVREAINILSLENLYVIVQGSGRVVRQNPAPGEKMRVGARCVIECEPIVDLTDFKKW